MILLMIFLSGCATKNITELGGNKYLAVANDTDGIISTQDSIANANMLTYQKCSGKTPIVESITTKNDVFSMPETSILFHCK